MPASDHDLLIRYWGEEPWGPYRDNMHAAIIATEVRRTLTPKSKVDFDAFMIAHPKRRERAKKKQLLETFKALAGGNRIHISELNERKRKNKRKRKVRKVKKESGSKP